jgi:hypothetical protein
LASVVAVVNLVPGIWESRKTAEGVSRKKLSKEDEEKKEKTNWW